MDHDNLTQVEADGLLEALNGYMASDQYQRDRDYAAEASKARNGFEEYWAQSASASVIRDYKAGRVVEVKA